jgi:hypothetical protein
MAFFNRTRKSKQSDGSHLNWMGGRSWNLSDPLVRLRVAASSCFFGEPMYYQPAEAGAPRPRRVHRAALGAAERGYLRNTLHALDPQEWRDLSAAQLLEGAIDAALDADPQATLAEAVRLRSEEHLRTTPQVILVRAANHRAVRGTGLVRRFAPEIVRRGDEPAVGLAYQLHRYGKPIPNALKRAWSDALSRADEYTLARYRLEGREVKTVDVMNLVHPRGEAVSRLAKGELRTSGRTWEAILSARGSTREAWLEALPAMGHMALLRNLRNLAQAGVQPAYYVEDLVRGAATGQQLPFRYYSAWRAVHAIGDAVVLAALEQCLEIALGNLPRLRGRVMSLCDNSGSAQGTTTSSMGSMQISTIANLTGLLAGRCAEEGWLGLFGDRLHTMPVRPQVSVFEQLRVAEREAHSIGTATEHGIWSFWDRAIREREPWDSVFVFSDMQAGHGGLYGHGPSAYRDHCWRGTQYIDVAKLVATYRQRVNPQVQVFLVQVAGYQDTLIPEFYDRTYILGGWGEGLLRFAAAMANAA